MKPFKIKKSNTKGTLNKYLVSHSDKPSEIAFYGSLSDCYAYIQLRSSGYLKDS